MKTVDKKSRLIARIFGAAFAVFLYKLLVIGAFSYNSMGSEVTVTASSNPVKFYFAIVWCSILFLVCAYFGFIAKLKAGK
ncbi:hypothetical protein [Pseudomonas zhanjiangensis]|uniref:Uncharacterized protein n=1 Tax=Pseudomonas zhanjiangensis TaxID=3239015 RepID=A0ABV3YWC2_9PSED